VLCGSLNNDFLSVEKNNEHYINEIFFISSSMGRFYSRPLAKRTGCPVPIVDPADLIKLSEKGRNRFYTSNSRVTEFADKFPAVFPSMLLAANNISNLKSKIPVIIENVSSNDGRINEINYFGLMGLLRDDYDMVNKVSRRMIKEFGESPKKAGLI
jgi:hypothetical protein